MGECDKSILQGPDAIPEGRVIVNCEKLTEPGGCQAIQIPDHSR